MSDVGNEVFEVPEDEAYEAPRTPLRDITSRDTTPNSGEPRSIEPRSIEPRDIAPHITANEPISPTDEPMFEPTNEARPRAEFNQSFRDRRNAARAMRRQVRQDLVDLRLANLDMNREQFRNFAIDTMTVEYKQDFYAAGEAYGEIDWENFLETLLKIIEQLLPLILLLIG